MSRKQHKTSGQAETNDILVKFLNAWKHKDWLGMKVIDGAFRNVG